MAKGDHCRERKDGIPGCSGKGRPTCEAGECLYGAEPCPNGGHYKAEGITLRFLCSVKGHRMKVNGCGPEPL